MNKSYLNHSILQENSLTGLHKGHLQLTFIFKNLSKKFDQVFPSEEYLASQLHTSARTIRRYKADLKEKGIIEFARRDGHIFETCRYELTQFAKRNIKNLYSRYRNLTFIFINISLLVTPKMASPSDVLLYSYLKEKEFKNWCTGVRELQTAPAHTRETTKKEMTDSKEHSLEIPKHIMELTPKLHLTKHGQIKLMALPKSSIDHGFEQARNTPDTTNVFRTMYDAASVHAIENNIPIDWYSYYKALEDGFAKKEEFYTSKKLSHKDVFKKTPVRNTSPTIFPSQQELVSRVRKANQERIAKNLPEDIVRERAYLLAHPEWVQQGRELGVDISRYGLEKAVTETESAIDCRQSGDVPPEEIGYEEVLD